MCPYYDRSGAQRRLRLRRHVERAHPGVAEIETAFEGYIKTGCVAFTDGLKGYRHWEKIADRVIERVDRQEQKNTGTVNLNNVNNFHLYIHERYSHYREMATQYTNRYNSLFSAVYRAKDSLQHR